MHFMRENLLETQDYTLLPANAGAVADRLFDTGFDVSGGTITFTFDSAVSFEKLWIKIEGITAWSATAGGSTIVSVMGLGSDIVSSFHEVTVVNQTVVTFSFTGSGTVYEIMLMPSIFDLDTSQRPMRFLVREMDPNSSEYRTEDGTLVSYAGQSEGKGMILIGWDYMPKRFTDQLRSLWKGPPLRRPFIIFPEPDDNPDDIFKVYWKNDFERVPSAKTLASGYTVNAILWEI